MSCPALPVQAAERPGFLAAGAAATMRRVSARAVLNWAMAFGPAAAWVGWVVARYGPQAGWARALALGTFTGLGVLGVTALLIAYLPFTVERLGFRRLGAWLRTWWDEDAR
jgi:hypothetical protein